MVGQTYVPAAYVFPIQIPYAGYTGDPPQYQAYFDGSPATIFGGAQPMVFSSAVPGWLTILVDNTHGAQEELQTAVL